MPTTNSTNDIVNYTRLFELPTALQMKNGLDMNNFKAEVRGVVDVATKNTYSEVVIGGLRPETTYVAFFALEHQGSFGVSYSRKNDTKQMVFSTPRKFSTSDFQDYILCAMNST